MAHCKELQIAYRAFATVQQRQLYIAKVDSIEKLFYNTKMANLRRPELGRRVQIIGRDAELRISMQPMPAQRGLPLQRNSNGLRLRIDGNCANASTQSLEPTPAAYWTAIDICR